LRAASVPQDTRPDSCSGRGGRGLHANFYLRYWPNVASTLDGDQLTLDGPNGPLLHKAHDFKLFANASIGWAFDL
jgi:hypothetical protein